MTTDAVRAKIQRVELVQAACEREIAALLGPNGFERYKEFRQAEANQPRAEAITNIMRARGARIDGPKQRQILYAYTKAMGDAARHNQEATKDRPAGTPLFFDEAARRRQTAAFDGFIAVRLGEVLNPDELRIFMDAELAYDGLDRETRD